MPLRTCGLILLFLLLSAVAATAESVRVEVVGLEDPVLQNVKAALSLPPGLVRDGKIDRRWLERFRRQIPEKARRAVQPFGYYDAEVTTEQETVGEMLRLRVHVETGRPVRIDRVRVELTGEGSESRTLQRLARAFPLASGEVLRHDLYEQGKGALKSRATDLGYLDAEFTEHLVRVNRGERTASIDLVMHTGPLYRFGEVTIEGAETYPPRFLRRYLSFERGDTFSYGSLGETQRNFLDSDRFREVLVNPREEEAAGQEVPVTIRLEPSLPKRLKPGVGFATDTGARFTLRYQDLNVFRLGHAFEADLLLAELRQTVGVNYIVPSRKNLDSQTAFRVGYDWEDVDAFDRRSLFAEVERIRALGKGRLGSVYLRLLQESYTIGGESNDSFLVLPGVRFSRRRYNDDLRPTKGYFFSLESRGTHQALGSDTALWQFLGTGNIFVPLPGRFSLFIRSEAAVTLQNDPLEEIPASLRFFTGGDQSVRGYAYQSLGPENADGEVTGGKNLLVGSLELERAFYENWGVVVFYDAGNAFNDFSNYDLRQSVGLGGRWYTPVGPVKLDLARQIRVDDPSYRIHLSVGFGW